MPATFIFTKFVPNKLKNYLHYATVPLSTWEWWILMVDCLVDHPTNHTTMVELFAATAAWMWRISPPHPQEPLRIGLAEDGL
jgi:hypothetical protein